MLSIDQQADSTATAPPARPPAVSAKERERQLLADMELDVATDGVSDGNPNPGLTASDISEEGLKQLATLLRRFRKVNRQIQHAKATQTAAGRGGSTKKSRLKITLLEDEQKRISDEISVLKGNAPREPLAPAPAKEDLL